MVAELNEILIVEAENIHRAQQVAESLAKAQHRR